MGGQLKISLSSFLLIFALLLVCVDDDVYCGWSGRASGLVINAHELILVSWESWFRLHPDILSLSHFNLRHYLHDQALQGSLATTLRQLEYNFLYNFVATVRQLWDNFKTTMGNFLRQIFKVSWSPVLVTSHFLHQRRSVGSPRWWPHVLCTKGGQLDLPTHHN